MWGPRGLPDLSILVDIISDSFSSSYFEKIRFDSYLVPLCLTDSLVPCLRELQAVGWIGSLIVLTYDCSIGALDECTRFALHPV